MVNKKIHKALELSSLVYLGLPLVIFSYGWTKKPIAAAIIAIMTILLYRYIKFQKKEEIKVKFNKIRLFDIVIASCVIVIWVIISGIGGFGQQTLDYDKHNALMSDLVSNSWPVNYNVDNSNRPLVYYIGYYLPAAAVGRITHNPDITNLAVLIWAIIGVLLVCYWTFRLTGVTKAWVILLFALFSGMDIVGQMLLTNSDTTIALLNINSAVEWYTGIGNIQYSGNTTLLFWVPQHAIVGWLAGAITLSAITEKRKAYPIALPFTFTLLWSPFVCLGLMPLILIYLKDNIKSIRQIITVENALSLLLCIFMALYYLSGSTRQPMGNFFGSPFASWGIPKLIAIFTVFILLEFGIIAMSIRKAVLKYESKEWKRVFVVTIACLLIMPLLRYGIFNDLVMRVSIPLLFTFFVLIIRYLARPIKHSANISKEVIPYAIVASVLAVGSLTSLAEFNTHAANKQRPMNNWTTIGNPYLSDETKVYTRQYMGDNTKPFFRYISQ